MMKLANDIKFTSLSSAEIGLYSRHILIPSIGVKGQLALKNASVLIVGAGGLGCPALLYLAAAGVGRMGIIDADHIDVSNVHRQVLYRMADKGKNKVDIAKLRLQALNPYIEIETYIDTLNLDNAEELISRYDIVVDGTDNFTAKYLINDACYFTGKPLVYGAIMQFEGQVAVFNAPDAQGVHGANYRDLYSDPPDAALAPNCAEAGVLGILPGIIGCFQANEVIKLITGLGWPLSERLLIYDALDATTTELHFSACADNPLRDLNRPHVLEEIPVLCSSSVVSERFVITLDDFNDLIRDHAVIHLIDVRELHEREQISIGGIHIPLAEIDGINHECINDVPIILYCQSGVRSQKAAKILADKFRHAQLFSLKGGISAFLASELYPELIANLALCQCEGFRDIH
ncbi:molybdopterin-synthase adenylyltransferase MoeB [Yersinia enterocolitica]|uniref:HesA/MoeB/ThiF family protein n=1 Tax=Yersinia TaxID=629 RepID=UPI0011A905D6|nr:MULTISPECIES: HesA/MoeB/ThiF family protein [Yersinia]MBX9477145.1 HesA/MoeB/ThiF family protein [Yersinia enterocolitica]MBX9488538.1 HesA/MoeB/ThiF family protein [Yersinia enterocolitica]MBX9493107.1 HesA/MoeB/ThiF family protein [Yersinia enterocolitica]